MISPETSAAARQRLLSASLSGFLIASLLYVIDFGADHFGVGLPDAFGYLFAPGQIVALVVQPDGIHGSSLWFVAAFIANAMFYGFAVHLFLRFRVARRTSPAPRTKDDE